MVIFSDTQNHPVLLFWVVFPAFGTSEARNLKVGR